MNWWRFELVVIDVVLIPIVALCLLPLYPFARLYWKYRDC